MSDAQCGRGGIGRRAGFRFPWRKSWGFESLRPHHANGPRDQVPLRESCPPISADEERDVGSIMQVTETRSESFQREFEVVLPKADLAAKVDARLGELKQRVQIRGFRPGKVPVAHLKRVYGRSAMLDVINSAVNEATSQLIAERGLKLATEPKVTLSEEEDVVEKVIQGRSDLSYKVA